MIAYSLGEMPGDVAYRELISRLCVLVLLGQFGPLVGNGRLGRRFGGRFGRWRRWDDACPGSQSSTD
jgi:hypothetical protein